MLEVYKREMFNRYKHLSNKNNLIGRFSSEEDQIIQLSP